MCQHCVYGCSTNINRKILREKYLAEFLDEKMLRKISERDFFSTTLFFRKIPPGITMVPVA
jgi:hypothetical protein